MNKLKITIINDLGNGTSLANETYGGKQIIVDGTHDPGTSLEVEVYEELENTVLTNNSKEPLIVKKELEDDYDSPYELDD